jgi:hypothetical protein
MKPLNSHSIAELAALGTIPVLGVFLMWALWPVHGAIKMNSAGSVAVLAKAGTALDTINAPPHDDGHQIVYGTLSGISQTTKNIGILAAQGAEQVKQSGTLIQATTRNLDAVGTAVTGTLGHLNTASDQIAGVAHTADGSLATLSTHTQTAIDTANTTLGTLDAAVKLHSAALKTSEDDFDKVLVGIPPIEDNVRTDTGLFATTIGTTNHMLFTFDAVETKATHSYLHPPHGAAAIWPTIRPFLLPITQVGGAVAIEVAK